MAFAVAVIGVIGQGVTRPNLFGQRLENRREVVGVGREVLPARRRHYARGVERSDHAAGRIGRGKREGGQRYRALLFQPGPLRDLYYGYATWALDNPKANQNVLKTTFHLLDRNGKVLRRVLAKAGYYSANARVVA